MRIFKVSCLFIVTFFTTTCSSPEKSELTSLINTDHLNHLYEEVMIDNKHVGTIWIYAEAPDYHLVTDEDEGFTCVDDVARTLVFYARQYLVNPSGELVGKIRSLSEFLLFMQAENGYFYNFLLPGPQVNKTHQNSRAVANWWSWRALWALSEVTLLESATLVDLQSRCHAAMDRLLLNMENLCSDSEQPVFYEGVATPECLADMGADQTAVIMIGLTNRYRLQPTETTKALLTRLGNLLLQVQMGDEQQPPHYAFLSWRNFWHAWGNSQAYALLYTGRILQNQAFIDAGINEVKYFYPYCIDQGFLSGLTLAKEEEQLVIRETHTFSQIAYGIRPMIYASLEAYKITGDPDFAKTAGQLGSWFFGNNQATQKMYDPATGRTFDGIGSPEEVNRNSGAESTIEGLLSLQAIEQVETVRRRLDDYIER